MFLHLQTHCLLSSDDVVLSVPKSLFWARLHTEVADAAEANCAVFLHLLTGWYFDSRNELKKIPLSLDLVLVIIGVYAGNVGRGLF